jgi:hypothetical protein
LALDHQVGNGDAQLSNAFSSSTRPLPSSTQNTQPASRRASLAGIAAEAEGLQVAEVVCAAGVSRSARLMPYEQRVEKALQRILASRSWSKPQRDWLQRIANQTKAITIVDREALDDDALLFRREGGGWPRLNKLFGGELDGVLQQFQREVWAA